MRFGRGDVFCSLFNRQIQCKSPSLGLIMKRSIQIQNRRGSPILSRSVSPGSRSRGFYCVTCHGYRRDVQILAKQSRRFSCKDKIGPWASRKVKSEFGLPTWVAQACLTFYGPPAQNVLWYLLKIKSNNPLTSNKKERIWFSGRGSGTPIKLVHQIK